MNTCPNCGGQLATHSDCPHGVVVARDYSQPGHPQRTVVCGTCAQGWPARRLPAALQAPAAPR